MIVNLALEREIIDFLEQHNGPTVFGFYKKISGGDFSLVTLPLNEIQRDTLMNDFFLRFKVNARNYFTFNHFPRDAGFLSSLAFSLRRRRGRVTPVTVKALHDAALNGFWPVYLHGQNG